LFLAQPWPKFGPSLAHPFFTPLGKQMVCPVLPWPTLRQHTGHPPHFTAPSPLQACLRLEGARRVARVDTRSSRIDDQDCPSRCCNRGGWQSWIASSD